MATSKNKYRRTKEYLLVYSELINAAKCRGTLTYKEIAKRIGFPNQGRSMSGIVSFILDVISEEEVHYGRPMLSALVNGIDGTPGRGFYHLAHRLGKMNGEDYYNFIMNEREAVYDTWK
jgi:hypothetical protein